MRRSSTRTRGTVATGLAVAALLAGCTGSPSSETAGSGSASGIAQTPVPETASPSVAVTTAPAVKASEQAELAPDVVVKISKIRTVTVKATEPGQVSGKAVALVVEVRNQGSEEYPLDALTVNASTATRALDSTTAAPADPLSGAVPAGERRRGTYVFSLSQGATLKGLVVEVLSDRTPLVVQFRR